MLLQQHTADALLSMQLTMGSHDHDIGCALKHMNTAQLTMLLLAGFWLKPAGFHDANPSLDIPPGEHMLLAVSGMCIHLSTSSIVKSGTAALHAAGCLQRIAQCV